MKTRCLILLASASTLLAACGRPPQTKEPSLAAIKQVEIETLKSRLKDPNSAVITNAFMSRNAAGAPALCGYVNARNSFGGMTGPQRFIAGPIAGIESDFAPGEMDKAWTLLCSRRIAE